MKPKCRCFEGKQNIMCGENNVTAHENLISTVKYGGGWLWFGAVLLPQGLDGLLILTDNQIPKLIKTFFQENLRSPVYQLRQKRMGNARALNRRASTEENTHFSVPQPDWRATILLNWNSLVKTNRVQVWSTGNLNS